MAHGGCHPACVKCHPCLMTRTLLPRMPDAGGGVSVLRTSSHHSVGKSAPRRSNLARGISCALRGRRAVMLRRRVFASASRALSHTTAVPPRALGVPVAPLPATALARANGLGAAAVRLAPTRLTPMSRGWWFADTSEIRAANLARPVDAATDTGAHKTAATLSSNAEAAATATGSAVPSLCDAGDVRAPGGAGSAGELLLDSTHKKRRRKMNKHKRRKRRKKNRLKKRLN